MNGGREPGGGCLGMLVCFGLLLIAIDGASAAEPAREFLKQLRQRRYHKMALEYLDRMESSALAPVELKQTIAYERASILIAGSSYERDQQLRERQLDQAQTLLNEFITKRRSHPLASSAQTQLANLLEQRATMKVQLANRPEGERNKAQLMADAQKLYDQSYQVFKKTEAQIRSKLEAMPKVLDPRTQKAEIDLRDQLRQDYLQTQLLAAVILEEKADTLEPGSNDRTKLLVQAAAEYQTIYEKYRKKFVGLYARMYQGRTMQKLDKLVDALGLFIDVLDQPDFDAFRPLKTKTLYHALQCWSDPSQEKYVEAIKRGSAWLSGGRPNELQTADWLRLRYQLAATHRAYGDYLRRKDPKDRTADRQDDEAKKWALEVAKYPGEFQDPAKELLAELGARRIPTDGRKKEPTNFSEAQLAGREAIDAAEASQLLVDKLPGRIANETDAAAQAELQKQLDEAKQAVTAQNDQAMQYYRLAMSFATGETSIEDLNAVRYFLCYLHYSRGEYYEAGLLGRFLAQRYPGSAGSRPAARIAMYAFRNLYTQDQSGDPSFEIDQLVSVAETLVKTWPNEAEAQEALTNLIPFMIQSGELEKAQSYLNQLPAGSSERMIAELSTGQALWSDYYAGAEQVAQWEQNDAVPVTVDLPARKQSLAQMLEQAESILQTGVTQLKEEGEITADMAPAVLSFVQLFINTKRPDRAIELLEDETVGLLPMVRQNSPVVADPNIRQETLKIALRSYINALPNSSETRILVDSAKQVMEDLKQATGESAEGQRKLIAIYVSLARDLKKQIDLLETAADKEKLTVGFETFLGQVSKDATEVNVLNWVAETYSAMGEALTSPSGKPSAKGVTYHQRAAQAYQRILEMQARGQPGISDDLVDQIKMRLAASNRRMNKFVAARDLLLSILKKSNAKLTVQQEAARTYQEWARYPKKAGLYLSAVRGSQPDPKTRTNVIWGWLKLANVTSRYPEYRDVYYEASYNVAVCQHKYATAKETSAADRAKYLKYARTGLGNTYRLFPDLGKWEAQYDALLRRIQKDSKEPVNGLAGIKQPGNK